MRATAFFISLCLFLLGGNTLDAVSHAPNYSSVKSGFQQDRPNSQFALLESTGQQNEKSFLFCEEAEDEDEKNSLAKKYRELNKYVAASSTVQLLHSYYKAPKAVTAQIGAAISPRYILLRTLRI